MAKYYFFGVIFFEFNEWYTREFIPVAGGIR